MRIRITVVDLVTKLVGKGIESLFVSMSPHEYGNFDLPFGEFCDYHIGTIWQSLQQFFKEKKRDFIDIGKHSALFIKVN